MIILKTDEEIELIRKSGRLAASVLDMIQSEVVPGVSTDRLNKLCHDFICDHGAIAAPLNYRGFPKSICTSRNHIVCHGIPSASDFLAEGDILNIDVTTILGGYHGDTNRTFFVGEVSSKARRLVEVTKAAMEKGIEAVKVGGRIGHIGEAIQDYAEYHGFSVVRDFVGHGIGRGFHEDPQVPHFKMRTLGPTIRPGMVFTIEPMINEGHWETKVLSDGWTAVTKDGKLSAQFEHTIGVNSRGEVEILTL